MRRGFSWSRFESSFIQNIVYSEQTEASLRPPFKTSDKDILIPYMEKICPEPNPKFVDRYRKEIADHFLAESGHLCSIAKKLSKRKNKVSNQADILRKLRTQKVLFFRTAIDASIVREIMLEMYMVGRGRSDDAEGSFYNEERRINLHECIPAEIPMYDYQRDAIDRLHQFFLKENDSTGLLVMPTGSGKTRVATRFLVEHMITSGWQVIWIAHQTMLLEQAAEAFYETAAAILPAAAPSRDAFQMICVSGSHANIRDTRKDHDVMLFSVQTLARNLDFLQAILRDNVIIVVDEAHRAEANSYRKVIDKVRSISENVKLLGLTATPIRFTEAGTAHLMELFNRKVIFNVPMGELIAKNYLSKPKLFSIDTSIDFYKTLDKKEKNYIETYGRLSPTTIQRIAQEKSRNKLIVQTYLNGSGEFGKTLIFALNGDHCKILNQALRECGVNSDYIYCKEQGNDEKIAQFRNGEIDVLINIEKFTEGIDVPDIQTVFLTRPTNSERLLVQMVGRGMRGVGSGGTRTLNIVDFHDMWGSFTKWLTPSFQFAVPEAEDDAPARELPSQENGGDDSTSLETIRALYEAIEIKLLPNAGNPTHIILPAGWYDVIDENGNDCKVLVFDAQISGYDAMWDAAEQFDDDYSGDDALAEWFGGFGLLPSPHELQLLLDTYRDSGEKPPYYSFEQREAVDAADLARQLYQENVGVADLASKIHEKYQENAEVIESLYGGEEAYSQRVRDFMNNPSGVPLLGMKIEELPYEILPFDPTPIYNIRELAEEVASERFDGGYGALPQISWTDKAYRTYFGMYTRIDDTHGTIRINRVLNSKDVPREAVKYIIFHEMLHRDNMTHNADFRAKEHQYPGWTELERFLDSEFSQFDIHCSNM